MKRYRYILLLTVAVMWAASVQAQVRLGLKGGMITGDLHFNKSLFDTDRHLGYTGGVVLELGLPVTGLSLDASAMYSRHNNKLVGEERTYHRDYVEVPVNVRYGFHIVGVDHLVLPFVFTGPNFAFLCDETKDRRWDNRSLAISWQAGFGAELFRHIQVMAGYSYGLNHVMKQVGLDEVDAGDRVRAREHCWTVTAAYMF
ncbi:MAG: porin family protein [Muribaculaceae bacterium]|nr:porin family protein [Muribaculaceae bacterium]